MWHHFILLPTWFCTVPCEAFKRAFSDGMLLTKVDANWLDIPCHQDVTEDDAGGLAVVEHGGLTEEHGVSPESKGFGIAGEDARNLPGHDDERTRLVSGLSYTTSMNVRDTVTQNDMNTQG